ncbi:MAG TPA: PilZ domain-containing protein, partial [Myxococcota bacterium]|nr:PilZ domain-containing protein [Myxococcota bacterium]
MPRKRTNTPSKQVPKPRQRGRAATAGGLDAQRRSHARFELAVPVTFVRGGRSCEARTVNLSRGGMLLKGAGGWVPGARYLFHIAISGRLAPLAINGEVVAGRAQIARIKFSSNQEVAFARLHAFVVESVIPRLESAVRAEDVDLRSVIELAALYADDGRNDVALALFRHHWTPTCELHLHEAFVRHLLQRLGTHSQDPTLQAQIEEVCGAGLLRGASPLLTAARDLVTELRGQAAEATDRAGGQDLWSEEAVRLLAQVAGLERRASTADSRTTEVTVRVAELASRLAAVELHLARFDDI